MTRWDGRSSPSLMVTVMGFQLFFFAFFLLPFSFLCIYYHYYTNTFSQRVCKEAILWKRCVDDNDNNDDAGDKKERRIVRVANV